MMDRLFCRACLGWMSCLRDPRTRMTRPTHKRELHYRFTSSPRSHVRLFLVGMLLLLGLAPTLAADSAPDFELKDGDRVVTLGGTFVEREGQFGYIETVFTTAFPDRKVTCRRSNRGSET